MSLLLVCIKLTLKQMIFTFVAVKFIAIFLLFCSRIIYTALFEKKKKKL